MTDIVKEPGGVYQQGELRVVPRPDEWRLAELYFRFQKDGLLPLMFYHQIPSLSSFLQSFSQEGTLVCYVGEVLAGMGWTNNRDRVCDRINRAEVSEAFFKGVPMDTTLALGKLMLEWAFDTYQLDVVFGTTPIPNRAAVIFARRMGFEECGVLPCFAVWQGEPCSVMLTAMTRERWEALKNGRLQAA